MPQGLNEEAPLFQNFLNETLGREASINRLRNMLGQAILSGVPFVPSNCHGTSDQPGQDTGALASQAGY